MRSRYRQTSAVPPRQAVPRRPLPYLKPPGPVDSGQTCPDRVEPTTTHSDRSSPARNASSPCRGRRTNCPARAATSAAQCRKWMRSSEIPSTPSGAHVFSPSASAVDATARLEDVHPQRRPQHTRVRACRSATTTSTTTCGGAFPECSASSLPQRCCCRKHHNRHAGPRSEEHTSELQSPMYL